MIPNGCLKPYLLNLYKQVAVGKPRRLWRLAVAPHPPIAETPICAVSRGDTYPSETHCKLQRSAAVG